MATASSFSFPILIQNPIFRSTLLRPQPRLVVAASSETGASSSPTKLLTFLGKGGSGKTTAAIFAAQHYAMAGLNTCLVIHSQDTTADYLLDCKIGTSHVICGKNLSAVRLETTKVSKMILLKDIVPAAQNNIDTKFILLEKGRIALEGQNKICLALVADETAAIHFQLWGDECDAFNSGDIIYLTNGIFSYQRGNLILRAGKRGKLEKIGEFTMSFFETPNMSEIHWIPDPSNTKNYIQEYVISPVSRIFPPVLV